MYIAGRATRPRYNEGHMNGKSYSFGKGLVKGLLGVLTVASSMLALTAFSDISLWGLLETYLKPLLGSLTVGGLVAMLINWLRFRSSQ